VNPFNVIELVEDLKGAIRSQPFKYRFTGGKNHADRHPANTTYAAYVLISHQLKYTQHCSICFHNRPPSRQKN